VTQPGSRPSSRRGETEAFHPPAPSRTGYLLNVMTKSPATLPPVKWRVRRPLARPARGGLRPANAARLLSRPRAGWGIVAASCTRRRAIAL